jgi:hypothetical protein
MKPPAFIRNILTDLVEKRLWPVAVLLVAALIATPVILGGGDETAPPLTTSLEDGSTPAEFVATEDDTTAREGGRDRNPFTAPSDVKPAPAAEPSAGTTGTTSGAGPVGSGTGGVSGGAGYDVPAGSISGLNDVTPIGGSTRTATPVKTGAKDSYAVDIRFGKEGTLTSQRNVPRLSPLPSSADPFFVFLGVLADGETALFLVSSDAEATGDGKCLPSLANCERVEMQAGQTEFFDVTTPEGETVQYQLDLVKVARERNATASAAAAARTRESAEGREILRNAVDTGQVEISDLAFSPRMGLVVPSGTDQEQAGSLFGGYRVDLHFGAPGALTKRFNLARLTPLPSVDSPSFIYLGVLGDGETALFLNPSDAAASGDAVCSPTPEQCDRVEMKAGSSATFDVATIDGASTQYQLALEAITPIEAATPEEAEASLNRESKAGRVILRRLIHEVGSLVSDLSYSSEQGAVVPAE